MSICLNVFVCTTCMLGAQWDQKNMSDPLGLESCRCWGLNMGPLEEQPMLLTRAMPLVALLSAGCCFAVWKPFSCSSISKCLIIFCESCWQYLHSEVVFNLPFLLVFFKSYVKVTLIYFELIFLYRDKQFRSRSFVLFFFSFCLNNPTFPTPFE